RPRKDCAPGSSRPRRSRRRGRRATRLQCMATDAVRAQAPPLLRARSDGIETLTLNRPAQRNALDAQLLDALSCTLAELHADPELRAVILAGSGPAFCAGHDLREMRAHADRAFLAPLFARCAEVMLQIVRLPVPVIARVHGIATAAGCQLVATC